MITHFLRKSPKHNIYMELRMAAIASLPNSIKISYVKNTYFNSGIITLDSAYNYHTFGLLLYNITLLQSK
jgi:hypothetical protein